MIILALDTCEPRGSLAVLRDSDILQAIPHQGAEEYSSWVLPTAEKALRATGIGVRDVDMFAVASGPGSFTGVRIGLATVKAWCEAYRKPATSVSRLEAMASQVLGGDAYLAAFVDAHRDQVYGGLYRREGSGLKLVETEMVAAPLEFMDWVRQRASKERVSWVSLDPEKMTAREFWRERAERGEGVDLSTNVLAPAIGRIGRMRALEGLSTDALGLDAEYVRRPDAEVYWKRGAGRGS